MHNPLLKNHNYKTHCLSTQQIPGKNVHHKTNPLQGRVDFDSNTYVGIKYMCS